MPGLKKNSKTDWERVRSEAAADVPPAYDPDAPNVAHLMRAKLGRPAGSTKALQSVRFDLEILAAFKATGKGWQTRMNEALRTYLKEHPMTHA